MWGLIHPSLPPFCRRFPSYTAASLLAETNTPPSIPNFTTPSSSFRPSSRRHTNIAVSTNKPESTPTSSPKATVDSEPVKAIPFDVSSFKELSLGPYVQFDRSLFLREFFECGSESVLIIRPPRWAKSTNLSMTKSFFDMQERELAYSLFQDTTLSVEDAHFCNDHCGGYPVVSVNFGDVAGADWPSMEKLLCERISQAFASHTYLSEVEGALSMDERSRFLQYLNGEASPAEFTNSLKDLTAWLSCYHRERVIVLLDDYDAALLGASLDGFHDEASSFIAAVLSSALTDNLHLERALLTGVYPLPADGALSQLHYDVDTFSLLDSQFADSFGIRLSEVARELENEDVSEGQVRDLHLYHGGYDIAVKDDLDTSRSLIFNPSTALQYLHEKKTKPSWTSALASARHPSFHLRILEKIWMLSPASFREKLLLLLEGSTLEVPFSLDSALTDSLSSPPTEGALWSFLYFSGYITGIRSSEAPSKDGDEEVEEFLLARIPNGELNNEFREMWLRMFSPEIYQEYDLAVTGLSSGQVDVFESNFSSVVTAFVRDHDLSVTSALSAGFFIGILLPLGLSGARLSSIPPPSSFASEGSIVLLKTASSASLLIHVVSQGAGDAEEDLKQLASKALKQLEDAVPSLLSPATPTSSRSSPPPRTPSPLGGVEPSALWSIVMTGRGCVAASSSSSTASPGQEDVEE
eukprot:TRINITY_DN292_c0_g1_i5.p1 TRINITY_DN292_c0_g1~~TRINITY_DN292_c0_g1_i5.p1  ORF type:complete len:742 (-),score=184.76 TRINITY_DN292_c0_g1_i5:196-2283(-)